MSYKPSLPKGTRDMLPQVMLQRNFIINTIKQVFKKFGFQAIETPALEKVDTLTGKYGEEGDRLIFKIQPRGEKLKAALKADDAEASLARKTEEALRYDLTVPFARFVVQNQNELNFPFKRFQIQPVWRADRPQKGRFREFVQCDADVVGSTSLLQELEFIAIYHEVFTKLSLPVNIKLNNRKVLAGLAEAFGVANRLTDFTIALDKLDKIGAEGVEKELQNKGFPDQALEGFRKISEIKGDNADKLATLEAMLQGSETGRQGLEEVRQVMEGAASLGNADHLIFDLTLARGLDYYTGAIFEVQAQDLDLGSLGGGGRYDDLTGIFGLKNLPGIGISFGLDRIQIALEEKELLPDLKGEATEVLFINFGQKEALYSLQLAQEIRRLAVNVEVYPDAAKMKKQMDYANKNGIKKVILIGENEIKEGLFTLKNMETGKQQKMSKIELLEFFNSQQNSGYGRH